MVNKKKTGYICVALEGHLHGKNITSYRRYPIDVNHFASTNVKKVSKNEVCGTF